jgi:hypothetical protein
LTQIALATEVTFEGAEKAKAYLENPEAFAAAAAPVAEAAAAPAASKAAEKEEEKEEESDDDMGFGLFGPLWLQLSQIGLSLTLIFQTYRLRKWNYLGTLLVSSSLSEISSPSITLNMILAHYSLPRES